jgi:hypothetical protein
LDYSLDRRPEGTFSGNLAREATSKETLSRLSTPKDLVGISTAKIVWTKRRGEDEVRRDGSILIVNVSSLDPADAREVVLQLRIEGLEIENEDQDLST